MWCSRSVVGFSHALSTRSTNSIALVLLFFLAFCSFVQATSAVHQSAGAEQKRLEIKNVRLVAWQTVDKKGNPVEVHEFWETKPQHLMPSNKFDVECEIVGGEDDFIGDYFVWTAVDFLVAPVTCAYEQMDDATLGSSVAWALVTEMRDLKATPIYFLRRGESRNIAVRGLNLSSVLTAFPLGEDGELWPRLIRVTVHVQDRSGKQLTSAERTLHLAPNSARKKVATMTRFQPSRSR